MWQRWLWWPLLLLLLLEEKMMQLQPMHAAKAATSYTAELIVRPSMKAIRRLAEQDWRQQLHRDAHSLPLG